MCRTWFSEIGHGMHSEKTLKTTIAPAYETCVHVPAGWSNRQLTNWFSKLEEQAFATFVNYAEVVEPILAFEEQFSARLPEIFRKAEPDEHIAIMLFARMTAGQSAAERLLFAGQLYEAQALMRSAVECGVYGCVLRHDPALRQIWANRGKSNAARERCREAFGWNGLLRVLDAHSHGLRGLIKPAYEQLIDMGAHPNSAGVGAGIQLRKSDNGGTTMRTVFSRVEAESFGAVVRQHLGVLHIGFELVRVAAPERIERSGVAEKVARIFEGVGIQLLGTPTRS